MARTSCDEVVLLVSCSETTKCLLHIVNGKGNCDKGFYELESRSMVFLLAMMDAQWVWLFLFFFGRKGKACVVYLASIQECYTYSSPRGLYVVE